MARYGQCLPAAGQQVIVEKRTACCLRTVPSRSRPVTHSFSQFLRTLPVLQEALTNRERLAPISGTESAPVVVVVILPPVKEVKE